MILRNNIMTTRIAPAVLLAAFSLAANAVEVKSPDGKVAVDFDVKNGVPTYSMTFDGKTVINPSTLGLELVNANDLMDGFKIVGSETSAFDETWQPVWARQRIYATIIMNCW